MLTNSKIYDIINIQDKESVLKESTNSLIRSPCKAIKCKGRADNFEFWRGKLKNQISHTTEYGRALPRDAKITIIRKRGV